MATKKVKKETESVAPNTTAAQSQTEKPAGTQQATDLNIADLRNIALVIDVASTRGAFRANEMATVGLIYNKLQAFLAKVAPEAKPEENKTAEAPAAAGK
jgi:phosphoketolase